MSLQHRNVLVDQLQLGNYAVQVTYSLLYNIVAQHHQRSTLQICDLHIRSPVLPPIKLSLVISFPIHHHLTTNHHQDGVVDKVQDCLLRLGPQQQTIITNDLQ